MDNRGDFDVEGIRCYWNDDIIIYKVDDTDCDAVYEQWHLGIEETTVENGFDIYPNPANGIIYVKSNDVNSDYQIVNILGETVISGEITSEIQQIDISNLSDGIYLIRIHNKTMKIIINK